MGDVAKEIGLQQDEVMCVYLTSRACFVSGRVASETIPTFVVVVDDDVANHGLAATCSRSHASA